MSLRIPERAPAGHGTRRTTPSDEAPGMEQTLRAWHNAGHSQRTIARELNIDRRKVKRIIDQAA